MTIIMTLIRNAITKHLILYIYLFDLFSKEIFI